MLSFLSLQIFTIGSSCKAALFDMRMTMEHVYYSSGIPDNRASKINKNEKKNLVSLFVDDFHCKQGKSRVKLTRHRLKKEWTEFLLWKRNCSSSKSDLQISKSARKFRFLRSSAFGREKGRVFARNFFF